MAGRGAVGLGILRADSYETMLDDARGEIAQGLKAQLGALSGSTRVFYSAVQAYAAEELLAYVGPSFQRALFLNSADEATDAALKLARAGTKRSELIALQGAYHGGCLGGRSLSAPDGHSAASLTLPDVHFADPFDEAATVQLIEKIRPAGVILEGVQVEAGVRAPPRNVLIAAANACREAGGVVMVDESRCGFGRTGRPWGIPHSELTPDILILGTPLGGGLVPAAAIVAREEAFTCYSRDPFLHTSTLGGTPLAAAAVRASLLALTESADLAERAAFLGQTLLSTLDELRMNHPSLVTEVSGHGAILGITLPSPLLANRFAAGARARGLRLAICLRAPQTLRLLPSPTWTEEDICCAQRRLISVAAACAVQEV
jgi:putrescine aminotransferase